MARLSFIVLFFSMGLSSASAQSGHLGTPQEQKACSRDASRFCRKQLGDDMAVEQCLQQNHTKLIREPRYVVGRRGQLLQP